MRLRRTVTVVVIAAAVAVPAASTAAFAVADPSGVAAAAKAKPKPAALAKPTVKPLPVKSSHAAKPTKAAKTVQFSAEGTVTAVNVAARTVTVNVKGGTKNVRRSVVTFGVPVSATVTLNDVVSPLTAVLAGQRVQLNGTHGATFVVTRLKARSLAPSPTPTPSPSPTASPVPTEEPTETPTETPTQEPTEEPTEAPSDV